MSKTSQRKKSLEELGYKDGRNDCTPRFQKSVATKPYFRGYRRAIKEVRQEYIKERNRFVPDIFEEL